MNQKRKFENKKVFLINNAGQKSLYIGLLVLTFLILLIGKADLAFVNRVSIIISDLSAPAISSISKQTKIIGNSFNYLKNTTSIREENKNLFTENIRLKKFEILSKIYENENILLNYLMWFNENITVFFLVNSNTRWSRTRHDQRLEWLIMSSNIISDVVFWPIMEVSTFF